MRTMTESGLKIGLYIHISTDSVYDVSETNFTKECLDELSSDNEFEISDEVSSSSSSDSEEEEDDEFSKKMV